MAPENGASETSPLLGGANHHDHDDHLAKVTSHPIDASAGFVPQGADPYEYDTEEDEEDGDIERQASVVSTASRSRPYEGIPEMKKQMPYILPAIGIGVFLAAADQTIIVSSAARIGSDLNALSKTSWIATAYFLTLTATQPLYGKLSDIFGRKECLLFAYVVFGVGCLFCGLSQNMNQLIASRAFSGIGGGGMTTVVSILMSDIVPLRERGKYQGYINIMFASGSAVGAPLGGILSDYISWRWAFLVQTPLCFVALLAVGIVLKMPAREQTHWKHKLRRLDAFAVLLLAAVVTLLLGLDRGSNEGWDDKYTITLVSVSLPLFVLFALAEIYLAPEPFAPGHIIFDRSLFAAYLCNFFSMGGFMAAIFYIPLHFQAVYGLSATQAGLRLIPTIICSVTGSLLGGIYMQKTGRYYWITVSAYTALTLGMAIVLCSAGLIGSSIAGVMAGSMVGSFGNGIGVTTTLIGLIANAGHSDQAVATACSYLFRSLGSVFGVSMSAALANQVLRTELRKELHSGRRAEEIAERVRESLEYLKDLEPAVREVVRKCYDKSTRAAFGLQVSIVFGAAVAAFWIREKKLVH
ncbi:MFS multidrug transporter [Trichodelitschia bisporula]|uniref:MFS multidrug transporter n=1 Tax=Trichodelitschia bisporula TaxID=703511 RepID=A0A6G1I3C0_9PEZI|nr:MFS multidrug transporter [Trichodelitschia bisporula]